MSNLNTLTPDEPVDPLPPADEDVTIRAAFLDDEGKSQITVIRTTVSADKIRTSSRALRSALDHYYTELGCTLLSVQVSYEQCGPLPRAEPVKRESLKFTLIQGGKAFLAAAMLVAAEVQEVAFSMSFFAFGSAA